MSSPSAAILTHLKEKGHAWSIGLALLAGGLYLRYGVVHEFTEQQLVANVVLAIVASMSSVGGLITLIVMGLMTKTDFGELTEFRMQLVTGVLVGASLSSVKLLTLFGLLHLSPRPTHTDAPRATAAPAKRETARRRADTAVPASISPIQLNPPGSRALRRPRA